MAKLVGTALAATEEARASMGLTWKDAEDIAMALAEKFPDTDPLGIRFTDLHKWVTELEDFSDDPKASNEGILEAIQMAWVEEVRNR
jgi:FeS assembly protein IscX